MRGCKLQKKKKKKQKNFTVMVHIKINELPKWKQLKAAQYIQNNE